MKHSLGTAAEQMDHLAAVFAARRDRLALELSSPPRRVRSARPIVTLQEHGYPVALGLASIAVLPLLVRVVFGQRKLLLKLVMAVLHLRRLGRAVDAPRTVRRLS